MPRIRFTANPKLPRDWADKPYRKDYEVDVSTDEAERWLRRGVAVVVPNRPAVKPKPPVSAPKEPDAPVAAAPKPPASAPAAPGAPRAPVAEKPVTSASAAPAPAPRSPVDTPAQLLTVFDPPKP